MNVDKPKFILTLIVLSYTAICSLYIHSYLTGDNPPIFILLFTMLPILNSDCRLVAQKQMLPKSYLSLS